MSDLLYIDIVRRAGLRWPLAPQLDGLATEKSPVVRCITLAKTLDPIQDDVVLGSLTSEAIGQLKNEAKRRHSGGAPAMPPLTEPRPRASHYREQSFA